MRQDGGIASTQAKRGCGAGRALRQAAGNGAAGLRDGTMPGRQREAGTAGGRDGRTATGDNGAGRAAGGCPPGVECRWRAAD